jgi:hypothetical protein
VFREQSVVTRARCAPLVGQVGEAWETGTWSSARVARWWGKLQSGGTPASAAMKATIRAVSPRLGPVARDIVHESRKQHHAANGRHMPFDPRAFVCLVASTHGCVCSCLASIACMCPLPRSRALDASICAKPSSCACFTLGKTDRFAVKPSIFRKKPFRYRRVLERTVGHQQLAKKAQL